MIPPKARILIVNQVGASSTVVAELEKYDIVLIQQNDGKYKVAKNLWSDTSPSIEETSVAATLETFGVRSAT